MYKINIFPSHGISCVGVVYYPTVCELDKCVFPLATCKGCVHKKPFVVSFNRLYCAIQGYMLLKYGF